MGKTKSDSDSKSQLVLQICNISNQRISSCVHRRHPFSVQSPLIDWYLVLQVRLLVCFFFFEFFIKFNVLAIFRFNSVLVYNFFCFGQRMIIG